MCWASSHHVVNLRIAGVLSALCIVAGAQQSIQADIKWTDPLAQFGMSSQLATNTGDSNGSYLITPTGTNDGEAAPVACRPTATVNSFEYLQNKYGFSDLVDPESAYTTINLLSSSGYMQTKDSGYTPNPPGPGTTPLNGLMGKEKYLQNNFKPQNGYTAIQTIGQSSQFSQPANGPWIGGVVQTPPTADFIYQQLASGEDVEMGFSWYNATTKQYTGGGHVVTLTGIDFNENTKSGSISFIDPFGGSAINSAVPITSQSFSQISNGYLLVKYTGGGAGNKNNPDNPGDVYYGVVTDVFAESPVPEPPAMLVMGVGGTLLLLARRRCTAAGSS